MKKMIILVAVFLSVCAVHAQTAGFVTEMLAAQRADYGQVSYLSAVYQGIVDETASYGEAFAALEMEGLLPYNVNKTDVVTLAGLACMMTELWPVKGGLMFRITKGSPRYAFRQLKADGILPVDADPSEKVSGSDVLTTYTACQNKYGSE
jgi:hypothetical protein